jgi:hypothetical protein
MYFVAFKGCQIRSNAVQFIPRRGGKAQQPHILPIDLLDRARFVADLYAREHHGLARNWDWADGNGCLCNSQLVRKNVIYDILARCWRIEQIRIFGKRRKAA